MPKPPLKLREKMVALLEARMAETGTDAVTLAKLTGVTKRCIDKWRSGETFSIDGVEDALVKMGAKVNVVLLLPKESMMIVDGANSSGFVHDPTQAIYGFRAGNPVSGDASPEDKSEGDST